MVYSMGKKGGTHMNKEKERVLWIDGLRGIACLAIFAHHFGCCFYPVTQNGPNSDWATPLSVALAQSPLGVLLNGNFWVCVFCIIAGFVAAKSHFSPPEQDAISLRRFSGQLLNRYFRMVLPVFWVSLAVLVMVKLQLFTNRAFFERYYIYWAALTYAEDFYTFPSLILETFVKLCFVGTEKYVMVLWSIRLLFYGYFVSILLAQMSWGRNRRILWVYLLLALGGLLCGLDLCMMGCFPVGTMLAWWTVYGKERPATALKSCASALLILGGLVLGGYPTFFEPTNFYRYLNLPGVEDVLGIWHVLGASMLMTGLCLSPRLQKLLSCRPLQWLGKISFSLYLVHVPVLLSIGTGVAVLLSDWGIKSFHLMSAISAVVTLLATLLVSALFQRFVEAPCARLSRRLLSLLEAKEEAAVSL